MRWSYLPHYHNRSYHPLLYCITPIYGFYRSQHYKSKGSRRNREGLRFQVNNKIGIENMGDMVGRGLDKVGIHVVAGGGGGLG